MLVAFGKSENVAVDIGECIGFLVLGISVKELPPGESICHHE